MDLQTIQQGRNAFKRGVPAADCPFAFRNTPCWETKDYVRFEIEFREKMNAWMHGWIDAQTRG